MADAIVHPWPVVRLKDAKAQGMKLYFTGKPCKYGHLDQRYTSSGQCLTCLQTSWPSHTPEKNRERAKQQRERNPERCAEVQAEWRRNNAERKKANDKAWRERNIEQKRANDKKWRTENRERCNATKRVYKKRHREKYSAERQLRRSRLKGAIGTHTAAQLRELLIKQRYKCPCCGKSLRRGYHVDHIEPLALGGSNDITNIQLLFPTCNLKKGALDPIAWARQNGRLL